MNKDINKLIQASFNHYANGNLDFAKKGFLKVLDIDRNEFNSLHHLGVIALRSDDLVSACSFLERAVCVNPKSFMAYNSLCVALQKSGKLKESFQAGCKSIEINKNFPDGYLNRGYTLLLLGKFEEAISDFGLAINLGRVSYHPYLNRAIAYEHLEKYDESLRDLDSAISKEPKLAQGFYNRGIIFLKLREEDMALENFKFAIQIDPQNAEYYFAIGNLFKDRGDMEAAIKYYDATIDLQSDYKQAYNNKGLAMRDIGLLEAGLACFEKAIAIDEKFSAAHFNRAWSLLQRGDFLNGFAEYEWRAGGLRSAADPCLPPVYDGTQDLTGRSIVILSELFLGDLIQFCRYALLLLDRGSEVTFSVPVSASKLISSLDQRLRFIGIKESIGKYDFRISLMSLPFVFGTTMQTVPNATPYLKVADEVASFWRRKIGKEGFKIAVCWNSGGSLSGRSFPVELLFGLAKLEGVRLISVQKDIGSVEEHEMIAAMGIEIPTKQLDQGADAFIETAAIIGACDLTISCCTSVAHLAGSLGGDVWVAVKKYPEWRWLLEGSHCPWYPNMRLFRQSVDGEWVGVFSEIKDAIIQRINTIKNV